MNLAEILDREILALVQKPSRYLGNEVNAVHKTGDQIEVRFALVFPDLYDLGLGNLGIHILYACLNKLPWASCERGYAPDIDMEAELRQRGLPLFALESKDSLGDFDGIGFTLQSELTYTNILNIIDLSGIPLRSTERDDSHPLVFAGGPAVFNPEPIAPFMDFFVIGDGEDAIIEIAETLRKLKGKPRKAKLLALSALEGVYVPALYPFETLEDGRVVPKLDAPKIRKRITRDLNGATFPTDYILPYTQQVHDRISLEVLRGCTQGCRFCQAGMTTRPVRERTLEKVDELLQTTLDKTGYEEVSLVSLSTCDYSRVRQLVENTVERARPQRVAVSLPSLRLDSFSVELADMVASTRRTGLTVAPEAASPRLRAVINKWIPDEELLQMSTGAYERGWRHVKLYFMIGLPTERDDDVEAIADLAIRTVRAGRTIRKDARVNLGVSTFVPKPFTPFQWAEQIHYSETERRQDLLREKLGKRRDIKFGRHEPEETFLEGLVSRGDRRAADLLEAAFRKGCRFDAWREHLRFDLWLEAIAETGFDAEDALRERAVDERLPWDHIDVMIPKQWFIDDWYRALELKHAQDCRHKRCHKCGVIDVERELCASMLRDNIDGRKLEAAWEPKPITPIESKAPVQRLWLRISRTGTARHLSHLEAMNSWLRSLRRVKAPLAYSHGFHPHPKMAFSSATPVGEETLGDYLDISLEERVEPVALLGALRATLPDGFDALGIREVSLREKSLMALAEGGRYILYFTSLAEGEVRARFSALMEQEELLVERTVKRRNGRSKRRTREKVLANIRPMIDEVVFLQGADIPSVAVTLVPHEGKRCRTKDIIGLLVDIPSEVRAVKQDCLTLHREHWVTLEAYLADSQHTRAVAETPAPVRESRVGLAG
jgi:radical SAM family uncharacterized protein/radical SAM-linked protein